MRPSSALNCPESVFAPEMAVCTAPELFGSKFNMLPIVFCHIGPHLISDSRTRLEEIALDFGAQLSRECFSSEMTVFTAPELFGSKFDVLPIAYRRAGPHLTLNSRDEALGFTLDFGA